jgi:hypothetical protein
MMLGYYGKVTIAAVAVLFVANSRRHAHVSAEEDTGGGGSVEQLTPQQATTNFPATDINEFRTISQDALDLVASGDQAAAKARIKDLETAWDDAQSRLQPIDSTAWTFFDTEIDDVLNAVRAKNPDPQAESETLTTLITSLTP